MHCRLNISDKPAQRKLFKLGFQILSSVWRPESRYVLIRMWNTCCLFVCRSLRFPCWNLNSGNWTSQFSCLTGGAGTYVAETLWWQVCFLLMLYLWVDRQNLRKRGRLPIWSRTEEQVWLTSWTAAEAVCKAVFSTPSKAPSPPSSSKPGTKSSNAEKRLWSSFPPHQLDLECLRRKVGMRTSFSPKTEPLRSNPDPE